MILDRQSTGWRVTIAGSETGFPRIEIYHEDRNAAVRLAQACRNLLNGEVAGVAVPIRR